MSKKMAIGFVITLMLFLTACGTSTVTTSSSQPASNTNQTNSSQPQKSVVETPKENSAQVEEAFSNFQGDQPATMSGNGNKEFKLAMPEGGFKLVMKTKDLSKGLKGLDIVSASSNIGLPFFASAGAGKSEDGWYVYERVEHMYGADDFIFKVQATGPYRIEVYKLPLVSKVVLPLSMNGLGTKAIGPFDASGPLTIKLKTADAKNAGFIIKLVDAASGSQTDSVYMNIDLQTQKINNTVDTSPSVTPSGSGSYFLMVEANGGCKWELGITK